MMIEDPVVVAVADGSRNSNPGEGKEPTHPKKYHTRLIVIVVVVPPHLIALPEQQKEKKEKKKQGHILPLLSYLYSY